LLPPGGRWNNGAEAVPPRLAVALLWTAGLIAAVTLWLVRPGPPPAPEGPVREARRGSDRSPEPAAPALPLDGPRPGPPESFRGDRRNTGRSAHVGPVSPELAFEAELGARITAQAVVDEDGRIFLGDHAGTFHAFDAQGRSLWTRPLGGPVWSTALVVGELVLVGSDAGRLHALARRDGEERWHLDVGAELDTGITPAPGGASVRFAAGRTVWSVAPDRTVDWRFAAEEKVFTTPAVDADGTSYVGSQDDHVYAIDPEGRLRWSYRTGGDVDGSLVLGDDGSIYAGSDDGHVHALRRDGTLRWAAAVDGYVRAPLGLTREGHPLAGVYGPRPRVVCLDREDGSERWSFRVTLADTPEIGVASGPLVDAAGAVYLGAHDDYIYGLTPAGALRWVVPTAGDVDAAPVLTPEGTLLVGSEDGRLYGLRQPRRTPVEGPD